VTQRRLRPRAAALLAAGAYAVHQLRYVLGYGEHSHDELAGQGHAYMTLVAPLLGVALAVLVAEFGLRLVGARASAPLGGAPRLPRVWALATACLLLAYAGQELIEGAVAAGHPAGAAGVTGHGGWVAVPLAAVIGLALALVARGARGALELAAEPAPRIPRPRAAVLVRGSHGPRSVCIRPVARADGARAPPLAVTA
jgi:hypothetical protein